MAPVRKGAAMVKIPVDVLEKFYEAQEFLEDWLLANDKEFIRKMRRARKEDLSGQAVSWEQAKKQLGVK